MRATWKRSVLALAFLATACDDPPPPGPDLVSVSCFCQDGCAGGIRLEIVGQVCTDASSAANLQQAMEFICGKKETTGFNVCKIENCTPSGFMSVVQGGCPADNGEFFGGDFGQARASAVPPSNVFIAGDDINDFTITPQEFLVHTTQTGNTLFFASMAASLGTTTFCSDGIFGDDEHTLADGLLFGAPFSVELQPDGSYSLPPGAGNFITTALLDGDRMSLTVRNSNLGGVYDQNAGIFTLTGTVVAQGADISLTVDMVFVFDNRPPQASAGADQVVECTGAGGSAIVHFSGAGSTDPDGADDLAHFAWFVDGVLEAEGQEVDIPVSLGTHQVTLVVADQQGSFDGDMASVTVEDTSPPQIEILVPEATEYVHSATIVLDYSVTDVCTGVASVTPSLDGALTLAGHGLESGQAIHLLTELPLGEHTFRIDTTDNEGNPSSASVTFAIVVTPESIQEDVQQFYASGAITQRSQGTFLLRRLAAAAAKYHDGNCDAARGIYGSFINTVRAQSGKSIDPVAAQILIADAQFLIDHCPELFAQSGARLLALRASEETRYRFIRGDADDSGSVDVSDAITTLVYLFAGGDSPLCSRAVDADDDGELAVSDAVRVLRYLFAGGPAPVEPFPACGLDTTLDLLGCRNLQPCGTR